MFFLYNVSGLLPVLQKSIIEWSGTSGLTFACPTPPCQTEPSSCHKLCLMLLGPSLCVCSTECACLAVPVSNKKYDKGRIPLSPAPAPRQAGNTRATCRGVVDKPTASPAAHTRMTGKPLLGVFGGHDFLTKATYRFGFTSCGRREI